MITEYLAELAGIFAADGSMQKSHISFWGNPAEDKEYYDEVLTRLFQEEFNFTPRCHHKRSNGVSGFYVCKKYIINRFIELGFRPGRKTLTVEVPDVVRKGSNEKIMGAFLRGFFDGDGCIHFLRRVGKYSEFKRKHHTYPRILLTSCSEKLVLQARDLLSRLCLRATVVRRPAGIYNKNPNFIVYVRGEKMLERWMKKIGMSSMSNKTKYLIWKAQGHCPTKTTLQERLEFMAKKDIVIR